MCNCTSFCFLWRRHSYMPHHIQGKRYQCPHDPKRSSWINPQFPHLLKWQWQPRPQYTSKCISNVWLLFRREQYQTSCFCPIWCSFFKIWQWCIAIFKRQKQTLSLYLTQLASPSSLVRSIRNCIFFLFMTINREGFMKILFGLWVEWASK